MPKFWYLALGVCLLGGCLALGLLLLSLCAQVQTLGILLYSRPPLPRYVDTCACTLFTHVVCALHLSCLSFLVVLPCTSRAS
jgi:hypothetical protein